MTKSILTLLFSILAISVSAQHITAQPKTNNAISNELIESYRWWNYVNPGNVNSFSSFTNVNPINYSTGVQNYLKRTAISLVGWINQNVNLDDAISNDSLIYLEPLVNLEQLLVRTNIGDAGLIHLRHLRKLRHFEVTISGSPDISITDKGMATIGGLKNMEILRLYFCSGVTDIGFEYLLGLTKLKELNLNGTGITDRSMKLIGSFPNLETLSIAATGITDEGAEFLVGILPSLPSLKMVIISNSKISEKGRNNLLRSRKGLSVIY